MERLNIILLKVAKTSLNIVLSKQKDFFLCIFSLFFFLLGIFLLPPFVFSGTSEVINVYVTPVPVAVSVILDRATIQYGELALGVQNQAPQTDPVITATNNGTVVEDFLIRGADTIGGGTFHWILSDTQGTNQYVHKFGVGSSPTTWTSLSSTIDKNLATSINQGNNGQFKLRIDMPTSLGTDSFVQHATSVTVTAVQH